MKPNRKGTSHPSHQQGVVLVVALIMLIVIGLTSVAVMRNVMNTDLVSENNRRHTQAMQAAQTALRYCEIQIEAEALSPADPALTTAQENWRQFTRWQTDGTTLSDGQPIRIPADYLNAATQQTNRFDADDTSGTRRPQCMAQTRATAGGNTLVVVTARGFSDNYTPGQNGTTQAGAVVWLQSIIQLAQVEG